MELITAKKKDELLKILVENCEVGKFLEVNMLELTKLIDSSRSEILSMLFEFNKLSLIRDYSGITGDLVRFCLEEPAHRKFIRGGFQLEELVLEAELEKLFKEVENLQKKFPNEDLTRLSQIAANISVFYNTLFVRT